jgi:hypothetical protein
MSHRSSGLSPDANRHPHGHAEVYPDPDWYAGAGDVVHQTDVTEALPR